MEKTTQQETAVSWAHAAQGHLNLVARAGTGKTTTLLMMLEKMRGQVFLGAFNKRIAEELNERAGSRNRTIKTMHSFGMGAWKSHLYKENDGKAPNLEVVSNKMEEILTEIADSSRGFRKGLIKRNINMMADLVRYAKNVGLGTLRPWSDDTEWQDIIETYGFDHLIHADDDRSIGHEQAINEIVQICKSAFDVSRRCCNSVIDFPDMVFAPLHKSIHIPKKDWILLDELQDLNPTQRELAFRALKDGGHFVGVGDPKQSIYSFMGGNPHSMEEIKQHLNSDELPLTVCFRCSHEVIKYANRWVPDIEAYEHNPQGEVGFMSGTSFLESLHTLEAGDVILSRNNAPLTQLALQIIKRGMGCQIEGREIGIGLIAFIGRFGRLSNIDQLEGQMKELYRKESAMVRKYNRGQKKLAQLKERILIIHYLSDHLRRNGNASVQNLKEYIKQLFVDPNDGRRNNKGMVRLSTIHKAKGKEWDRVFHYGHAKYIPNRYATEDWELACERNLSYIASTRAKMQLYEVEALDIPEEDEFFSS